jgi:hypothetical protein
LINPQRCLEWLLPNYPSGHAEVGFGPGRAVPNAKLSNGEGSRALLQRALSSPSNRRTHRLPRRCVRSGRPVQNSPPNFCPRRSTRPRREIRPQGDLDDGTVSQLLEELAGEMDRPSDRKKRVSGMVTGPGRERQMNASRSEGHILFRHDAEFSAERMSDRMMRREFLPLLRWRP